jgi:hypothetical protein
MKRCWESACIGTIWDRYSSPLRACPKYQRARLAALLPARGQAGSLIQEFTSPQKSTFRANSRSERAFRSECPIEARRQHRYAQYRRIAWHSRLPVRWSRAPVGRDTIYRFRNLYQRFFCRRPGAGKSSHTCLKWLTDLPGAITEDSYVLHEVFPASRELFSRRRGFPRSKRIVDLLQDRSELRKVT